MRIGIVCPTYNQASFLPAALTSIFDQKYDHEALQLVVVNDASTDGTQATLDSFHHPIYSYIKHSINQGTAVAINTGVKSISMDGVDALTWVSSDNVMSPDWLVVLERIMRKYGAGAVYAGFDYVAAQGSRYIFKPYQRDQLINDENCFFGPAFLIRKDMWQEHRGKISHDYDNWLRVEEACWDKNLPIIGVDVSLCQYNAHDARVTITRRDSYDAHMWRNEGKLRRMKKDGTL